MLSDFLKITILKCVNLDLLPRHVQLVFYVAIYWVTGLKDRIKQPKFNKLFLVSHAPETETG